MKTQTITLAQAADTLKTTPLNVLMHIKRGLLVGTEEDGIWAINQDSLDALVAKTGGGKADDVCASDCAKKHACGGGCR